MSAGESDTRENTPSSTTGSRAKRFAYKQLPTFNPTYYHAWAMDVEQAFAERKWSEYIRPPTPEFNPDPDTAIETMAFLSQSISYEHKFAIRLSKTAYDIWRTLQQRYASKTREDEVRLEAQLLDLRKSSKDTLDQHIAKFDDLVASIMDQQPSDRQYDDVKVNQYFLRTLKLSNISNED